MSIEYKLVDREKETWLELGKGPWHELDCSKIKDRLYTLEFICARFEWESPYSLYLRDLIHEFCGDSLEDNIIICNDVDDEFLELVTDKNKLGPWNKGYTGRWKLWGERYRNKDEVAKIMKKKLNFNDIPQFTRGASYKINVGWKYLEGWLQDLLKRGELDLNPDFQRPHVWNEDQQRKYVEFVLRGGASGKEIHFNHPGWQTSYEGTMVIVDGKQRLEAARKFMRNELRIFDGHRYSDFEGNLSIIRADFLVHVNNLATRKEVLQWYLDLNDGGVVHSQEEIDKVKKLLEQER